MNRALFLDRDGIINQRLMGAYVRAPQEFHLLDDVLPILRNARQLGYRLILITNQQGVGKGLMSMADLESVHEHMQSLLGQHHLELDAIYQCTDLDSSASPRRKPAPGMLLEAIDEYDLDAHRCWFLGDSLTDAQAGKAAGIWTALVGDFGPDDADIVTATLTEMQTRLRTAMLLP